MCENFNFPIVAKIFYSSMTAIKLPLTGRNRTGSTFSVDYKLGHETAKDGIECENKNE